MWVFARTAFVAVGHARKRFVFEIDVEELEHPGHCQRRRHERGGAEREHDALGRERDLVSVGRDAEVDDRRCLTGDAFVPTRELGQW